MLLDTNILIDYLRLHAPAMRFLESLSQKERTISVITQMELLQGCSRKIDEQRVIRFLNHFKIYPVSNATSDKALIFYQKYHWEAQLDIPDAFIAATAMVHHLSLVTLNMKHYKSIPGLKIRTPY